jgi:hypothetical protein
MRLRKDRRTSRIEAGEKRTAAWQELSLTDKLRSLAGRRGHSFKQVLKLTGMNLSAKAAFREFTE